MKSYDPLAELLREAKLEAKSRIPALVDPWTPSGFVLIDHTGEAGITPLGLFQRFVYRDGKSLRYTPAPGQPIPPDATSILVSGRFWVESRPQAKLDLEDAPEDITERFLYLMQEHFRASSS